MGEYIVGAIAALVSILSLVITIPTAINSARASTVKELREELEAEIKRRKESDKRIEDLQTLFDGERRLRRQYETYIDALVKQLRAHDIIPEDIRLYVKDDLDKE